VSFDLADDLVIGNSVTVGDTVINNEGLTIQNGPSVTIGGIDAGGLAITNVAPGVNGTDAVNVDQLTGTQDKLTALGMNFSGNSGDAVHRDLGETLPIVGAKIAGGTYTGDNLATMVDGSGVHILMSDQPKFGGVTINDGGSGRITGVTAGMADTDAVNVGQLKNVETTANAGWNLSAQGQDATNVAPGATVDLNNTDGTIVVSKTATGNDVTFNLADDLVIGNSVTVGDTVINGNGLTINNGPSITKSGGINAGGKKITNVLAGEAPTDAVNVSQLNATNQNVTNLGDTVNNFAGDQSDSYTEANGRGIRYVRTNDTDLPLDDAYAQGEGSTAVGYQATATGRNALALGRDAFAGDDNSVALGAGSVTAEAVSTVNAVIAGATYAFAGASAAGTVSVGSMGLERTITNVAAGRLNAGSTDAVNGSQLYATNQALDELAQKVDGGLNDGAVMYDGPDHNKVTLGGDTYNSETQTGGTTITNVGRGVNDSDAVNMSQLNEMGDRVTNVENQLSNLGDTVNTINNGGGIRYFRHNASDDSMPDAVADGAASVAVGSGATTTQAAENGVAIGVDAKVDAANGLALGAGTSVTVANSVALGAGSVADKAATPVDSATVGGMTYGGFAGAAPTGVVSVGDAGAERQITNVAAGQITATSTDAINGSQLYSVADTLSQNMVSYDQKDDGSGPDYGNITLKGGEDGTTQIHNVTDGEAPQDAATVGQVGRALDQIGGQIQNLSNRIDTVSKDANAGVAGAMAMSGMPQATLPGKSLFSAGAASFKGQGAVAIGVSKLSDDNRWIYKLNGSANTRGDVGVSVGMGFHW
jgi:autotransporter adhesin